MHELAPLIKDLAVILGVASLVALLFQKIHQPVVLGYLLAGLIIGPYTPPASLVFDLPNIQTLSALGVIFLMFSLGLEFSFHKLKRVGFSAGITGLTEVLLMLVIGIFVGHLIGWSFENSLFLGAALAISSTTIIIKALEELKLKQLSFAELVFGVLIVEDLLAVLLLVALSTISITGDVFSLSLIYATFKLILVITSWFLIGYFVVPTLFNRIMPYCNLETLTLISVALCLFLVCIAAYFHYSAALGAFIMGSILAETILVKKIETLIQPLRNIFAAVFFVSVGMLINPKIIVQHWEIVLLITAATIIGKIISTSVGSLLTGQTIHNSVRVGFSMAQIGEFSFIIIALGASLNVINSSIYPIIVAVSAITTFFTPYSIKFSGRFAPFVDQHLSNQFKRSLQHYQNWLSQPKNNTIKMVYGKAIFSALINMIIIAIIFASISYLFIPASDSFFTVISPAKALASISAVIISSPFVYGMITTLRRIKVSNKHKKFHLYLNISFWLIPAIEILILSVLYFHSILVSSSLIILMILLLSISPKQLEKFYHRMEKHLAKNLKNHTNLIARKGLFVIDYINGIAKNGSCANYLKDHPEIITNTNNLIKAFRAANLPVFFIRLAFDENYTDLPPYAPVAGSLKRNKKFILGHSDTLFIPELNFLAEQDNIFNKKYGDPFYGSDILNALSELAVEEIIFTGLATDNAIINGANTAITQGFKVIVVEDACAASTKEQHHQALLMMKDRTASEILLTQDVIEQLQIKHEHL